MPTTFPFDFPAEFGGAPTLPPGQWAPQAVRPSSQVITDDLIVTLHTIRGVQLYQFLPEDYSELSWGRSQRTASKATLVAPPDPDRRIGDIEPWRDWLSVWDGERDLLLWKGPVQNVTSNRNGLTVSATDPAVFLTRTRNPLTKRWEAADPAWVAGELWDRMIEAQGLGGSAVVRPDPEGERFDYGVIADVQMLEQTISDLVGLGLRWTVVSGLPILGPLGLDPIATLAGDDFLGEGLSITRDGAAMFNDVLVRGPDALERQRVDYHGQNLQTIREVDSMFGVSNVRRAAQQYLREVAVVRTRIELTGATVLHPHAPVSIDELMPSSRFVIHELEHYQLAELTAVEVTRNAGAAEVRVTMESVEEKIELTDTITAPNVTLGGTALS